MQNEVVLEARAGLFEVDAGRQLLLQPLEQLLDLVQPTSRILVGLEDVKVLFGPITGLHAELDNQCMQEVDALHVLELRHSDLDVLPQA